jgi:hypothetical protein
LQDPPKFTQILDFWFENKPSGNHLVIRCITCFGIFDGCFRCPRSGLDVAALLKREDEAAVADDGSLGKTFQQSLGVNVLITIFCDFSPIFGEAVGGFLKDQCYDYLFSNICCICSQTCQFFPPTFSANFFRQLFPPTFSANFFRQLFPPTFSANFFGEIS